jgi:CheY-like chemotaxis protein
MLPERPILIAEDNPQDILLIEYALQQGNIRCGFQVVNDGEQALAYLNGSEKYQDRQAYPIPSILLLDLNMPLLSGFEVLAWIRQQPDFHGLPVVVLSHSTEARDITRAYEMGATSFLTKPLQASELLSLVQALQGYFRVQQRSPIPGYARSYSL